MTILYFIIALGILVLVHEWGHFIVARRSGIKVEKFSIGFGPKLFSIKGGQTEYLVSLLPLGGYVKLFGEDPVAEANGDEVLAKSIASSKEAFSAKSLRVKLATVMAGPGMNLVLAALLMPVVFMVGRMIPAILEKPPVVIGLKEDSPAKNAGIQMGDRILEIDGKAMNEWSDVVTWVALHAETDAIFKVTRGENTLEVPLTVSKSPQVGQETGYAGFEPQFFVGDDPIVGEANPNSPAQKSGLQKEDRIVSINGQAVSSWTAMTDIVRASQGAPLTLVYRRKGTETAVKIVPEYNDQAKFWMIGITKFIDPSFFVKKKYGFREALFEGTRENLKLLSMTGEVLKRLFTFQLSYKALGGPIQIAQASGAAARSGLGEFLYFVTFLSLQLGILNLLPIPVLDGGHVLFMSIEGVIRRPLSLKFKNTLTHMGLVLLLGLMVLITINDVDRVWGFSEIWGKVRGIF